ncbi:MAG: biotin/lipoyl-containing protein, partial [Pseudomonadota bacterium]
VAVDLRPGVTLVIRLQTWSDPDDRGEVKVFYELNGQPRTIRVMDRRVSSSAARSEKAEEGNPNHVAAPMPGVIGSVAVEPGKKVQAGDLMLTLEAMKMETAIRAEKGGVVERVVQGAGAQVEAKDLLVVLTDS